MTEKQPHPDNFADRRRQAEEKAALSPENIEALSPEETRQTLHELQVHQIELEMQNEELRRTQVELDASRARYFDLYDVAPVGYFSLSETGLILEANLTAATLLSVPRGVLVKQPITRFIFKEDQDIYYRLRKSLLETLAPQVCELRMLRADAAPFWARLEATAVQDGKSGEAVCRAVVSDITERKQIEDAQTFLFQCGYQHSGDDFFQSLARYLAQSLGVDYVCIDRLVSDELTAQTVAIYNDGKFDDNVRYTLKDTPCGDVVGKRICCFPNDVCRLFPKDMELQKLRAESYVGTTLWSFDGKPIGLIAIIGRKPLAQPRLAELMLKLVAVRAAGELERKQAEEAVQQAHDRLSAVLESITDAFFSLDRDFRLTYVNREAEKIFRKTRQEMLGMNLWELFPEAAGSRFQREYERAMAENTTAHFEEFYPPFNQWYSVHAYPSSVGLSVYFEDITERKRAEATLQQTAESLARSNKDLEQFASVASHDLQEPLRTVSGFVQLLQRKYANQLDAEADTFIEYAVDGTKRMESLIKDLLAYARVGTRGLELIPTDAGAALRRALDNLHATIQETGAEIPYGELPTVRADGTQLAQLFQNLIGNALKFRGEATPKVDVGACREEDCWRFSVRDNGIGIDSKFQDQVFEMFRRLHTHKQYAGTGIGLAICKKIVERHGGRIWVESEPGQGATFSFTLPT